MRMSEEFKETREQHVVRENAERKEREAIFLREHRAKHEVWGPIVPTGIPGPAGPGPTQSSDTPGTDDSGLKA
jgi:hypothetical protein